ncbi:MAG: hypothetical protein J7L80_01195 [Thermoplasmata archaeon]|nr:hypothetical protein [Thermoplasmata archaeon]
MLGIAHPFEVGSILASRKIEIKDLNEEIKNKNATVFYWEQIKKISIDGWYNIVKIKVDGKKYKYVFNEDDFAAFIEVLRKTKKAKSKQFHINL